MRDRRASGATPSDQPTDGWLRAALRAAGAGLFRTLADDDDRAAYWVRHVRIGIVVSEVSALAFAVYALWTGGSDGLDPALLALPVLVAVTTPGILLLPLRAMMRDWRGPAFFYAWSAVVAAVVIAATRMDGGASSPLDALLFLSLTYTAVAYTPQGVVATGGFTIVGYLLFVELPGFSTAGAFFLTILVVFTIISAMASANSWAAYDRQVLLIRTQEMLASTDPLTGIPNRRLFLDRVSGAVEAAAWGHQAVVLLVDLDGFKAVNDADGHAAGDALLTAVGVALGGAVRETDTVARLGGDEFGVLADVTAGFSATLLAERLREAVAVAGARYGVTASVGVAEIDPGDDVEDLMHRADVAMYQAKAGGGDRVRSLDA
ncbi:GGDEF domain-containing protein [Blastococcus sp. TF02A_35]|uniref:GGDEF domain-containing protein n=1 Tax=Blastococcus sp. TF02A-35 TaxID=2559612 RepID=UPI0010749780|nr:GGDEF domain-containing protein [Blastococcus sp. TF02A_35]TFV51889.1 GGDEF domain-containing protein [Blastococcus sp. TF02A_35]